MQYVNGNYPQHKEETMFMSEPLSPECTPGV